MRDKRSNPAKTATGTVQQVDVDSDGSATLTVGGVPGIAIGTVTQVR